jgi:radical SAM superfamily enzyme YgiQ (UPF0313 family)
MITMTPSQSPGKSPRHVSLEKILLVLLPFWDAQIPPLGPGCLKSFLMKYDYRVTAADLNLESEFREIYDGYFDRLDRYVPADKKGNLYNIGNQVLRNHLMAHLNYHDEKKYMELVMILVSKTFYCCLEECRILELNTLIGEFYRRLETYFINLLDKEKPTVLGLSLYSDTLPASVYAARLAKERYPAVKIIVGGGIFADQLAPGAPNLEAFLESTKGYIDKIIIGEGEQLMLKFLRDELSESQRVYGLQDIGGKTMPMDSLPIPDFSDFDTWKYPYLAHYGARSCPYQCRFCSETVSWGKYRKKTVSQMVGEFRELIERHETQLFLMADSLLNPIATDLAKEVIKENVPVYWDGYLRVDPLVCDPENTLLWRRGGFYRARLGVESGSQRILESMHKNITPNRVKASLSSLANAGIKTTTYWVIGYPGETEEDFEQTLAVLEELRDDIYEADCNPFVYFLTGQVNSDEWAKMNSSILLYPAEAANMLVTQTWILDCEPSRAETYKRVNRFMKHIAMLGIPNPYSLKEIHNADERWKRLHRNAAPPLVSLKNKIIGITERINLKKLSFAKNIVKDDDDWF